MKTNSLKNILKQTMNVSKYTVLLFALACSSPEEQTNDDGGFGEIMEEDVQDAAPKIDDAILTEIIQRIPSPVELEDPFLPAHNSVRLHEYERVSPP